MLQTFESAVLDAKYCSKSCAAYHFLDNIDLISDDLWTLFREHHLVERYHAHNVTSDYGSIFSEKESK